MGRILSLGQDPVWRRFLVGVAGAPPGGLVLDVASGTGLVARELASRRRARVIQLEPSEPMLRARLEPARLGRPEDRLTPVLGAAEALPFPDATFDAVTFTYLLRYVDDPASTVAELARVLRPGGTMASLEFHVPDAPAARLGWWVYTRSALPAIGALASPAWARTGRFLGPSISRFARGAPLPVQVRWWQDAGIERVRTRRFLWGTAVVTWGVRRGLAR
jgi:demethylmenaquinone methyltransferase/2-methoxy-6-polyprenyl-1,4-benzoquinol methylase